MRKYLVKVYVKDWKGNRSVQWTYVYGRNKRDAIKQARKEMNYRIGAQHGFITDYNIVDVEQID